MLQPNTTQLSTVARRKWRTLIEWNLTSNQTRIEQMIRDTRRVYGGCMRRMDDSTAVIIKSAGNGITCNDAAWPFADQNQYLTLPTQSYFIISSGDTQTPRERQRDRNHHEMNIISTPYLLAKVFRSGKEGKYSWKAYTLQWISIV